MSEKKPTRIKLRNEAKILEAAQTTFASWGFHGATTDMIAEMADMSQSNLHNYFKTKQELYEAVLSRILKDWLDLIDDLNPDGDPMEELRRYISQKVEMARKHPEASRVFAAEVLQGAPFIKSFLKKQLSEKVEQFSAVVHGWVKAGKIRNTNPYHLIFLIWGSTQHYADFLPQVKAVMSLQRLSKVDFKDVENSISDIVLNGLLPR